MLVPELKAGQVVVMDNASFHKSPIIKELIENAGYRLVYLPPYYPDLNPIEKFWDNLKRLITLTYKKQENNMTILNKNDVKEATFIKLTPKEMQSENLAEFLKQGANLVKETEPNTKLWFALKKNSNEYAIFDVFPNNEGRSEHFAGKVANALKENAFDLVANGWDNGVIPNISNASILSAKLPVDLKSAKLATLITLKASPGQENNLAELLTAAAAIIDKTEPKTLFWVALKFDNETYGIFDLFADESGQSEHFAGQVAALLKEKIFSFSSRRLG